MSLRSKNLLVLGLIIGVFVAFALIGRFVITPGDMDRVNRGTLIVPHVQIKELSLRDSSGEPWDAGRMAGQWTLFYVAGKHCHADCKNALFYLMKRLRESLGKDRDRLRLALVHTDSPSAQLRDFIDEKSISLTQLHGQAETVRKALVPAFPDSDTEPFNHLYLGAPDGQIFMWYPTHTEMEEVLREADNIYRDLTRTLKGSLIG